jgi:hypothetical protein
MRRGEFTLLSAETSGSGIIVLSQTPVQGRACFNMVTANLYIGEDVFENAVRDALGKFSGANVLVTASFTDTGHCIEVQGLPGRI